MHCIGYVLLVSSLIPSCLYAMEAVFKELFKKRYEIEKIRSTNQELYESARNGDVQRINELIQDLGDKADLCGALLMPDVATQGDIIKILGDVCCCKGKRKIFGHPRSAADLLIGVTRKEAGSMASAYLPPKGPSVQVYSFDPEGALQAQESQNKPGAALIHALINGNADEVLNITRGGFPANALVSVKDSLGERVESVLQYAQRLRNNDLIDILIQAGADVNYGNKMVVGTPLHSAVYNLDLLAVEKLLAQRADPNSVDASGTTPLHSAASLAAQPAAVQIVKALLTAGADRGIKNNAGLLAIDLLEKNKNTQPVAELLQPVVEPEEPEEELEELDRPHFTLRPVVSYPVVITGEQEKPVTLSKGKQVEKLLLEK